MYYILYGMFIGFSIGMTIGPIAILCLKRSMTGGVKLGLATGLGASLAHLVFGSIAIFGFQFLHSFFTAYSVWFRLIGSAIILLIAFKIAHKPIQMDTNNQDKSSRMAALLSALAINLSNPITIASYAASFSIFDLTINSLAQGFMLLIGLFFGNLLWWVLLSFAAAYAYSFLSSKHLSYINIIAACLLSGLGVIGIATALYEFFA